jgi:hypothetical protein
LHHGGPRGGEECRAVVLGQGEGVSQHAHGFWPGRVSQTTLQVTDAAHAQPGALR